MYKQSKISTALLLIFCMSLASPFIINASDTHDVLFELLELEELNGDCEDSEEEQTNQDDYRIESTHFFGLALIADTQTHSNNAYNDIHTLLIVPPPER